eukprot:11282200-Alexandrium_andersonii.AAC.1
MSLHSVDVSSEQHHQGPPPEPPHCPSSLVCGLEVANLHAAPSDEVLAFWAVGNAGTTASSGRIVGPKPILTRG